MDFTNTFGDLEIPQELRNQLFEDDENYYARFCSSSSVGQIESFQKVERPRANDGSEYIEFRIHGVSVGLMGSNIEMLTFTEILSKVRKSIPPLKRYDSAFIFKFQLGGGLLHKTPSPNFKDHHDYYKADNFSMEFLKIEPDVVSF